MQIEKQIETSSTSSHRFSDFRSWCRGIAPLAALLLIACSGSSTERTRTDDGTIREAEDGSTASASGSGSGSATAGTPSSAPSTPATTPSSPSVPSPSPTSAPGPNLTYGVVDTTLDGEVPIRWTPVFDGPPRTRLIGDVLWAPAEDVVRVLSPGARVTVEGEQLKVGGKPVSARARVENGVTWVEVVPLARHFGALGRVQAADKSVVLFPRQTLLWLRDNGDPNAPAVREAREAGLLDG